MNQEMEEDLAVLGLAPGASQEEISSVYWAKLLAISQQEHSAERDETQRLLTSAYRHLRPVTTLSAPLTRDEIVFLFEATSRHPTKAETLPAPPESLPEPKKRVRTLRPVAAAAVLILSAGAFVWANRYRYDQMKNGSVTIPIRTNRFSDHSQMFLQGKWKHKFDEPESDGPSRTVLPDDLVEVTPNPPQTTPNKKSKSSSPQEKPETIEDILGPEPPTPATKPVRPAATVTSSGFDTAYSDIASLSTRELTTRIRICQEKWSRRVAIVRRPDDPQLMKLVAEADRLDMELARREWRRVAIVRRPDDPQLMELVAEADRLDMELARREWAKFVASTPELRARYHNHPEMDPFGPNRK